ncbi:MAG: hypothetical protein LIP23_00840 [Planctomycetes bacterium]|nr:hypothetical protein [Planctomycetota bacterium]
MAARHTWLRWTVAAVLILSFAVPAWGQEINGFDTAPVIDTDSGFVDLHLTSNMFNPNKTGTYSGPPQMGGLLGLYINNSAGSGSPIKTIRASGLDISGYTQNFTFPAVSYGYTLPSFLVRGNTNTTFGMDSAYFENVNIDNNAILVEMLPVHSGSARVQTDASAALFINIPNFVFSKGSVSQNRFSIAGSGDFLVFGPAAALVYSSHSTPPYPDVNTPMAAFSNLVFVDNTVQINGVNLTDSYIYGAALSLEGGNNYDLGAGSERTGMTVKVDTSVFSGNRITITPSAGQVNGNVDAYGSAIVSNYAARLVVENSVFTNNSISAPGRNAHGGAVYLNFQRRSYLSGDVDDGVLNPLGTFNINGDDYKYNAKFINSEFYDNTVSGGNGLGGAIYTNESIVLSGVRFEGNQASGKSNAIYLADPDDDLDRTGINSYSIAFFTDEAGSASWDSDGIASESDRGRIYKAGAGDLYLLGDYSDFSGTIELKGGKTYLIGGQAGLMLAIMRGATASLGGAMERLTINDFIANPTSTVIARSLGDTGESAYFDVSGTFHINNADCVISGKLAAGHTYLISSHDDTLPEPDNASLENTFHSLYGMYEIYMNADRKLFLPNSPALPAPCSAIWRPAAAGWRRIIMKPPG